MSNIDKKNRKGIITPNFGWTATSVTALKDHNRTERTTRVNLNKLQQANCTLIKALHHATGKRQVKEAAMAMEDASYIHASKRLLGAAEQLNSSHGNEGYLNDNSFDEVVEAWKPVQELLEEAGWKTASFVDNLPGMKMKKATFKQIALHLILMGTICTEMGCQALLASVEA